jgi:hypothetical protein
LGALHRREGDLEGAAILFQQAADLYHFICLLRDETIMKAMTAQLRLDQDRPREALRLMWEALQYFEVQHLPGDVGVARNLLREFRQLVESFDALWLEVTGQPPPSWLIEGGD